MNSDLFGCAARAGWQVSLNLIFNLIFGWKPKRKDGGIDCRGFVKRATPPFYRFALRAMIKIKLKIRSKDDLPLLPPAAEYPILITDS